MNAGLGLIILLCDGGIIVPDGFVGGGLVGNDSTLASTLQLLCNVPLETPTMILFPHNKV